MYRLSNLQEYQICLGNLQEYPKEISGLELFSLRKVLPYPKLTQVRR